jgi:hypothetical protein
VALGSPQLQPVLREHHVYHREKKIGVAPRTDEVVLACRPRGFAAAGIDDDDLATSLQDGLKPVRQIRRRHQAAVRGERVAAQDHQMVGAIDVRDGNRELVAEHERGSGHLGKLIDRARAEPLLRAQGTLEDGQVDHGMQAVCAGVAEVGGDGIRPVTFTHRQQPLGHVGVRVVPRDLLPRTIGALADGGAETVRILPDPLEPIGLGTDVAPREWILLVAPDGDDPIAFHLDADPAGRLAQCTDPVDGAPVTHHASTPSAQAGPQCRPPRPNRPAAPRS